MRLPTLTVLFFALQGFPLTQATEATAPIAETALQCPNQDTENVLVSIAPGTVKNTGPATVYVQAHDCERGSCRAYPSVPPSTKIIVESHDDKFACITYPNSNGNGYRPGFVKLSDIDIGSNEHPSWEGLWVVPGKSYINIEKIGEHYHVQGETSYGRLGNESFGQMDGISMPSGLKMIVRDKSGFLQKNKKNGDEDVFCEVNLVLSGDLMESSDNMGCGSTNVRFIGVYERHLGNYDKEHFYRKYPASQQH